MSNEGGTNNIQAKQPGCETGSYSVPKTCPQAAQCGQFHAYKLCTTPADVTSPIYELSVPFFDGGTPDEWIKFQRGLAVVLKG
eukprot:5490416-Ditylum_brightwellii.AAC.1